MKPEDTWDISKHGAWIEVDLEYPDGLHTLAIEMRTATEEIEEFLCRVALEVARHRAECGEPNEVAASMDRA